MNCNNNKNVPNGRCGDFARTCVRLGIWMAAALCLLSLGACQRRHANVKVLQPAEFMVAWGQDSTGILLDVRKPEEYAQGHLEGAILMNWLDDENFPTEAATLPKHYTIYVYCKGGIRSRAAADYLASQGHRVMDLDGGYTAWTEAGLPVVEPF